MPDWVLHGYSTVRKIFHSPLVTLLKPGRPSRIHEHLACPSSVPRFPTRWTSGATPQLSLRMACSGGGPRIVEFTGSCLLAHRTAGHVARPDRPLADTGDDRAPQESSFHCLPLRRRLKAIKRLDPKVQRDVLTHGLGRPRCQRAQQLLKRGDSKSVSARCPLFLQQLKPRLQIWKKAATAESLPPPLYPEVAFAGRSNAGKSTLLNELCGRSGTAFVSKRPGSTQELCFFKAGSPCCICLVDLPGYGYAEAEASKRLQWTEMCLLYLKSRPNLRRVFLLIDARWGLKASDLSLLSFFERHRVPFQVVLTKADLPEQKSLIKIIQIVTAEVEKFKGSMGPPIAVSALRHRGLDPLRVEIDKLRLAKEVVIGRLKMKAANLVEARRLKKEARARAKAELSAGARGGPAVPASSAIAAMDETTSSSEIIARALGRWGASLGVNPGKESAERLLGKRCSAAAEGASQNSFSRLWTADSTRDSESLGSVKPHAMETNDEPDVASRIVAEDLGAAADAFDRVLDSAAEMLPLPAQSNAEALITDCLPSLPRSCVSHMDDTLQQTNTGEGAAARASHVASTEARMPLPASPSATQQRWFPEFDLVPDARESITFHEFSLEQSFTVDAVRQGPSRHSNDTDDQDTRPWEADKEGDIWFTAVSASSSPEGVDPAFALHDDSRSNGGYEQLSDPPGQPANNTRPLEALRAKDWRARRVSRAAVEIDMSLSRDAVAGGGSTIHLPSDPPSISSTEGLSGEMAMKSPRRHPEGRQALPDLTTVLDVTRRPHTGIRQARRVTRQPPAGTGLLIDEETLAAEELCRHRSPSLSKTRGTLQVGMQRCFDQKWRRELLPLETDVPSGGLAETVNCGKQRDSSAISRRSRIGSPSPFRIPADYITTREDSRKPVTKRMMLEVRLQRAQEAAHPADDSLPSDRDRRSADALFFSAAQRRQERRLRELTMKAGRKKTRAKEMTWDVAYRRWTRWAKAHSSLASQTTRPTKARLFATFRQKQEKLARKVSEAYTAT